jgi:hypothetical protein
MYDEYILEISDNQNLTKFGKFHTLNYKLISSKDVSYTVKEGEKFSLYIRYKIISTSTPFPDETTKNKGNLKGREITTK